MPGKMPGKSDRRDRSATRGPCRVPSHIGSENRGNPPKNQNPRATATNRRSGSMGHVSLK